jgi:hypothetical protein
MECKKCGAPNKPDVAICEFCNNQLVDSSSSTFTQAIPEALPVGKTIETAIPGFNLLPPYYKEEFNRIQAGQGVYKGKWNWAAFCFNWIWAFTKGLWLVGVICLGSIIVTGGALWLVWPFIFGVRGNYQYYNSLKTGKQPYI